MTPELALLHAIREEPEDDGLRLILADWLDDNGDPDRAEFIRLQVARDRAEAPIRALAHRGWFLQPGEREALLLAAHQAEWTGVVPEGVQVEFSRGLLVLTLDEVRTPEFLNGDLPARLERLFREGWVEQVRLVVADEDAPALAACPYLACVSHLCLAGYSFGPEGAARLARSPLLARLNGLDLAGTMIGDEGAERLAASPHLARLRRLHLEGNGVGPAGALALASSPFLGRLTGLNLECNDLGEEGGSALAAGLNLPSLLYLNLSGTSLGPAAAEALAALPAVARLVRLDVSANTLGQAGVLALVSSPYLQGLTHLHLRGTLLDESPEPEALAEAAARSLAEGLRLPRLSFLDLSWNSLRAGAVAALAACPGLASLKVLGLVGSANEPTGEEKARALACSPFLTGLTHLELEGSLLGDAGAAALAASPILAGLRYLGLSNNLIGEAGAQALAASPHLGRLEILSCTENTFQDSGSRALIDSTLLASLTSLYLDWARGPYPDRAALRRRGSSEPEAATRPAPGALAALAAALDDPDPAFRGRVLQELGNLLRDPRLHAPEEEPLGQELLSRALGDPSSGVRLSALRIHLELTQPADLLPALLPLRQDESAAVRTVVAENLGRCGEPSHLVGLLQDDEEDVRLTALRSLRELGNIPAEAVPALRQGLRAQEGQFRRESAVALLEAGAVSPELAASLRTALEEGNPERIWLLTDALARVAPAWPEAVEILRSGLSAADRSTPWYALRALVAAGRAGCEVWPILAGLLAEPRREDPCDRFRCAALSGLADLGPAAVGAAPALFEAAREPRLRVQAVRALIRVGAGSSAALIEEPDDPTGRLLLLGLRYKAGGELADSARAQLRGEVLEAVRHLGRLEAIRHFRTVLEIGLKDSRNLVDEILREAPAAEG